ncbi:MAG: DUF92 domain-containing protein [Candidatus Marinimicrobia bacterium]|nr:DUF92 domain-containing protein [Candidatus Neomarinimicrobiota bacterium]MCF7828951.1 DUF92 domain-containing protein [Candidatus Neomarinimicrobiota bacterium]MCF7879911.1 DUF92 domain-containing protein [Candidatus Neomarinimicrobiota bacterium]
MFAESTEFPVYQPFASEWLTFALFFLGIMLAIGLAEFARAKLAWSAEASRKIVHILVGLMIFWARFLFDSPVPAVTIALVFIILNLIAIIAGGFEGMHATDRQSLGTVFYPLTFLILVVMFWYRDPAILLVSFLILALGDPIAAQVGETVSKPRNFVVWRDRKSVQGSSALLISAFIISFAGLYILRLIDGHPMPGIGSLIIVSIAVAVVSTFAESISWGGSDNLTLPLSAALAMDILLGQPVTSQLMFMGWIFVAFLLSFGAYRLRVLNLSGTVAAFLLGTFVFGIGGLRWVVPMGAFFVLSSLLSKFGKQKKDILHSVYEKTGNRDMMQVLANGGLAGLLAIIWHYTQTDLLYFVFLGGLAAATADTWATELGVFSRQQPRSLLTLQPVAMGTSGGITLFGTLGATAGAAVLGFSGWIVSPQFSLGSLGIVTLAGLVGSMVDSILGATVQAQYKCPTCDKITEKTEHCGNNPLHHIRGFRLINNDVVNLACTVAGALAVIFLV